MTQAHQARSGRRLSATVTDLEVGVQRAFLVGVILGNGFVADEERSLDELALLTDTAGSVPVDRELVKRDRIDPATHIGSGKADDLAATTRAANIDVVVFDHPLSPAQQRNLQKRFRCDVVDREALILDIFAQHASSKVGSVQVELALLKYNLPRLRGKGASLSQQGAGIGARGPGETKLETDRRRILARISKLERELKETARHLDTQRKRRKRTEIPQVAIVGYTNAGKSTLLNAMADADAHVEDRLFATLDPTTRRTDLPTGRPILLSDTVGFVRRLPHGLVEALRSTLSEVAGADLLLHLVDGTEQDPADRIAAVREVLGEIDAEQVPELVVFNKADLIDPRARTRIENLYPDAVMISATTGEGVEKLAWVIADRLQDDTVTLTLAIPYERSELVAAAYQQGEVIEERHDDEGNNLEVRVPLKLKDRFSEWIA